MSMLKLYLLTRLSELKEMSGMILVVSCIVFTISFLFYLAGDCEMQEQMRDTCATIMFYSGIIGGIASLCYVVIPSKADIALIISGYWATHSEKAVELPDKLVSTLTQVLDNYTRKE